MKCILTLVLVWLLPSLRLPLLLLRPRRSRRPTPTPCGPGGTAFQPPLRLSTTATCPAAGGGRREASERTRRRSPAGRRWSGCGTDRRGGGQQSGAGARKRKRRRNGGDDGGSGGGGDDDDGAGEAGLRSWRGRCGCRQGGGPAPAEEAGRKTRRRSDEGRGGGGGRSGDGDGETGRTGTAGRPLSAGTGRASHSRLLLVYRVSPWGAQGPPPPLCQSPRPPAGCRTTSCRYVTGGEAAASDWPSF